MIFNEDQPKKNEYHEVKMNKYTTCMLVMRAIVSAPFYVCGMIEPSWLNGNAPWVLFMEAFHHFHARIFYLLALYHCFLQVYFAFYSNGFYQRRFMLFEVFFDVGLIGLYIHENFFLHNIAVLWSKFFIFHATYASLSLLSIQKTHNMKVHHIV